VSSQDLLNDTVSYTSQANFMAPNYMVDIATGILVDAKNTMSLELLISTVP